MFYQVVHSYWPKASSRSEDHDIGYNSSRKLVTDCGGTAWVSLQPSPRDDEVTRWSQKRQSEKPLSATLLRSVCMTAGNLFQLFLSKHWLNLFQNLFVQDTRVIELLCLNSLPVFSPSHCSWALHSEEHFDNYDNAFTLLPINSADSNNGTSGAWQGQCMNVLIFTSLFAA